EPTAWIGVAPSTRTAGVVMTAPPTPSSADRIPAPTPTSIVTSTVATSDMSTGPTLREHSRRAELVAHTPPQRPPATSSAEPDQLVAHTPPQRPPPTSSGREEVGRRTRRGRPRRAAL